MGETPFGSWYWAKLGFGNWDLGVDAIHLAQSSAEEEIRDCPAARTPPYAARAQSAPSAVSRAAGCGTAACAASSATAGRGRRTSASRPPCLRRASRHTVRALDAPMPRSQRVAGRCWRSSLSTVPAALRAGAAGGGARRERCDRRACRQSDIAPRKAGGAPLSLPDALPSTSATCRAPHSCNAAVRRRKAPGSWIQPTTHVGVGRWALGAAPNAERRAPASYSCKDVLGPRSVQSTAKPVRACGDGRA